ncbi:MAG: TonB-dependent receptor [Chitinophagaceae bacterium]
MKKCSLLLMLFLCIQLSLSAQTTQVKGRVLDDSTSAPLSDVNVLVSGTTTGTQTDKDGKFSVKIPADGKKHHLSFSITGYVAQIVEADLFAASGDVAVRLKKEVKDLEDVVVIGYAAVKRRDVTGSVSSVAAKDLKDVPVNSIAEALAGRLAGVQVTTTEGKPGADIMVRVRGGGSVTQDNSPLYIVDGIQVDNAMSLLTPQEIQSIDVLKDAASTAIYGARGANGVVLITTKGGKEMKTRVSYDGYAGVRSVLNKLDVLKPYDFVQYQYQRYNGSADDRTSFQNKYGRWEDLDIYKNMPFTDWQDELFGRDAWNKTHTVSLVGGSKTTTFSLNLSNTNEDGVMLESGFKRTLASFKFDHRASDRLRVGFSARYSRQRVDGVGTSNTGSQGNNRLRNAVRYKPFIAESEVNDVDVFDPDYANLTNLTNPVLLAHNELKYDYRNDINVNGYFSYELIKNLTFRSVLGITNTNAKTNQYNGSITSVARSNANMPIVNMATGENLTLTNSNTLNYKTTINRSHNIDLLVGQEINEKTNKTFNATVKWMPVDLTPEQAFAGIQKATPPTGQIQDPPTTSEAQEKLLSFFGRAMYNYNGRYLLTVTMRYDGSSKFAKGRRFASFPSAALAWRISEENFMRNVDFFSDLKLRVSFGTSGNNRIDNDMFRTVFGTNTSSYAFEEAVTPGIAPPSTLSNPYLKWETTIARNIGLDFSIFNNKVTGSLDFYRNTTRDLLLNAVIPLTSGSTSQYQNTGKTENTGIELQLGTTIINNKNFTWSANFNISGNRNKIVSLGLDATGHAMQSYYTSSGWVNALNDFKVEVGKPVGQYYGFITDGFYTVDDFNYNSANQTYTLKSDVPNSSAAALGNRAPQPGDLKLKKLSSKASMTIDDEDKTVLGNSQPKFMGGLNQQFVYKGFDLSVFVNWSVGNKTYNANRMEFTTTYQYKDNNMLAEVANRYKLFDANGNKVTDPAALSAMNTNATMWTPSLGNYFLHSYAIEDASFLRISNLTIGYSLPASLLKKTKVFSRFRFYLTVNNLYTFTKYSGYDPEANTRRSTPLTPGVDYAAYPRSRFILGGVNVSF